MQRGPRQSRLRYEHRLNQLVGDTVYILKPAESSHPFLAGCTDGLATVGICLLFTRDGPGSVDRLVAEAPPGGAATKRIDDNGIRRRCGFRRRPSRSLPRDPLDPGQVTRFVRSGSRALRIPQRLRQTLHEGVLDSVPVRET